MALNKKGSPNRIQVVKCAGFTLDLNFLAEMILKQVPERSMTITELHSALESIGVVNYSSDDMSTLIGRLSATGFAINK